MSKVFMIDPSKCNGCHCCQIVCKDEHCDQAWLPYAEAQPDTGQFWRKVEEKVRGTVPKVMISYLTYGCMHCEECRLMVEAPGAVYRREDGLVIIDPVKSKGMKELVSSCPYGTVFWNEELQIPQKCTGCAHLLDDGWEVPRCVDSCPTGALRFGEEAEFAEEVAKAEVLHPEYGTSPQTFYINLPKRFIGGCLYDKELDEALIGAKVTLQNTGTGEVLVTETDDFGDFWFKQIEPGKYNVYFEADGYMTRMIEADTTDEDKNVGNIDLYAA